MNIAIRSVELASGGASTQSLNGAAAAGSSSASADFQQTLAAASQPGALEATGAGVIGGAKQEKAAPSPGNPRMDKQPESSGNAPKTKDGADPGTDALSPTAVAGNPELLPLLLPVATSLPVNMPQVTAAQTTKAGDQVFSGDEGGVKALPAQHGAEGRASFTSGAGQAAHIAAGSAMVSAVSQSLQLPIGDALETPIGNTATHHSVQSSATAQGSAMGANDGKVSANGNAAASGSNDRAADARSAEPSPVSPAVEQRQTPLLKPAPMNESAASTAVPGKTTISVPPALASNSAAAGSGTNAVTGVGTQSSSQNATQTSGSNAQAQSGSAGAQQASGLAQVSTHAPAPGAESFAAAAMSQGMAGAGSAPVSGIGGPGEQTLPAAMQAPATQAAMNGASGTPAELSAAQTAQGGAINTARVLETMNGTEMRVGVHSADFGSVSIAATVSPSGVAAQIALEHGALGQALSSHLSAIEEKLGTTLGVHARIEMRDTGSAGLNANSERAPGGNSAGTGSSAGGGRSRGQADSNRSYSAALEPVAARSALSAAGRLSVQA